MGKAKLAVSQLTFRQNAEKWLKIVRYNESGMVLNFIGDHIYTVPQLLDDKKTLKEILGKYYNRYIFVYAELNTLSTVDSLRRELISSVLSNNIEIYSDESIEQLISELVEKGYEIAFLVTKGEKRFEDKDDLIVKLDYLARNYRVSVVFFSELNFLNAEFQEHTREFRSLFQNVIYQEIYGKNDADTFVSHNEKLWEISVPQNIREDILEKCGGSLWLLRQAIRSYRNDSSLKTADLLNTFEIKNKIYSCWNQLFPGEQEVIRDLVKKQKKFVTDMQAFEYLIRIKLLVRDKDDTYRLSIPLLETALTKPEDHEGLYSENQEVYYGDKNIGNLLTKKEKAILFFFLKNESQVVDKEKIGMEIWGNSVSAWAIEKIISKLRKKLFQLGMPKDAISTKKGAGYVFSSRTSTKQ